MPNVIEIYTNNEKSRVREITVNNLKVILRKSRVNITNDNIYVLSFLELMNFFSIEYFNAERKDQHADDMDQVDQNFRNKISAL